MDRMAVIIGFLASLAAAAAKVVSALHGDGADAKSEIHGTGNVSAPIEVHNSPKASVTPTEINNSPGANIAPGSSMAARSSASGSETTNTTCFTVKNIIAGIQFINCGGVINQITIIKIEIYKRSPGKIKKWRSDVHRPCFGRGFIPTAPVDRSLTGLY